ncbi:hypothetical protein NIES208_10050 [[Limnothrix rosea] IAM M-220]|nr:hypothetical protein NIES208_10050 [[Limnothrix rosea] IAM M-220]
MPGSAIANIEAFFERIIKNASILGCRGCFIVNTMVELAPHDPQVATEVEQLCQQVERTFTSVIDKNLADISLKKGRQGEVETRRTNENLRFLTPRIVWIKHLPISRSLIRRVVLPSILKQNSGYL